MPRGGGGGGGGSGSRKKPLTYKEKSGIHFVKQDEPDFIKKMKTQLGYREHKLEDKFEGETSHDTQDDDDDDNEFGANGPQVVVLDPEKDISREELDKELSIKKKEKEDKMIEEGRIVFRKPGSKRDADDTELEGSSTKKSKDAQEKNVAPVNKSLLSFGDDEEE